MLNFICIGAQKSGTTWLYEALSKHPIISFPGGKEVHYWDNPSDRPIQWYLDLFTAADQINGDITPAYAILSLNTIQKIYQLFPNLRLIYLIRDPVDRAWSSARMALARAEMTSAEASDQWFIDHFKSKGSRSRGDYETCLRNWRSVFPSKQMLILHFDSIKHNPVVAANTILQHIGLDSFFEQFHIEQLKKKVFEGDGQSIRPSLLPVLNSIYKNQILSFENYLKSES